ncbi:MAG: hypothetical protein SF162_07625 [bacterium]|nr:hypothetical protein [bacterium]
MKRIVLVAAALLMMGAPIALAQECAYGRPCQGVPWRIDLPFLPSPTPAPTQVVTTVPSPTATPGTVNTQAAPAPTATFISVQGVNDQLATLQSVMNATPVELSSIGFATLSADGLGVNAGEFMRYVAGLRDIDLRFLNPAIIFAFGAIALTLSTTLIVIFLPIIARIFEWIRRIIQLILQFIPGLGVVIVFQSPTPPPAWPTLTPYPTISGTAAPIQLPFTSTQFELTAERAVQTWNLVPVQARDAIAAFVLFVVLVALLILISQELGDT